jgi:hypothetical protein
MYHATNRSAAASIFNSDKFRAGPSGMFGGGIYFADEPNVAQNRALHAPKDDTVIIVATVDL